MRRDDVERDITFVIFGYETLALLPGSPLVPITRMVSDHPVRVAAVTALLAYHFHRHRKEL